MGDAGKHTSPMVHLPWDSDHFGVSIARIDCTGLTGEILDSCVSEAAEQHIQLLEAFCSIANEPAANLLEANGFRLTGIQLHLEQRTIAAAPLCELTIRKAQEADLDALREMSWGSYTDSRYFSYPGINSDKIHSLYRIWMEKGVRGAYDDECRILERGGHILAFCCLKFERDTAKISLFGVNPSFRRQGNGLSLLNALKSALLQQGIKCIVTTTQAKNFPAIRLYEKAGFMSSNMTLWFCRRFVQ